MASQSRVLVWSRLSPEALDVLRASENGLEYQRVAFQKLHPVRRELDGDLADVVCPALWVQAWNGHSGAAGNQTRGRGLSAHSGLLGP